VLIVSAAACELYVISTDVDGIPELLLEEARTLCPPSARIFAQEVLNTIRTKRDFHEAQAQRARIVLSQRLSWRSITSQLLPLYSSKRSAYSICFECTRRSGPFIAAMCLVYFALFYLFIVIFR
jgi:glycosyltransferase involved in cell wall biosynthesis